MGGGIIKYLLDQVKIRDQTIEKMITNSDKTNSLNEKLAELYVALMESQSGKKGREQ